VRTAVILIALTLSAAAAGAQEPAPVHQWAGNGLRLEVQALTLDQTRAFFLGRSFDGARADEIARTGCFFRSDIGNASGEPGDPVVELDLSRWRVNAGAGPKPLWLREDWRRQWRERGIAPAPSTAFHWALFPTRQSFSPGDYNWGMITMGLKPGSRFRLEVRWRSSGREEAADLTDLECADERAAK